jgi:hypothetical protein
MPGKCPEAGRTFILQNDLRKLENDSFNRPTDKQKKKSKPMSIQMKTATQAPRRDYHG